MAGDTPYHAEVERLLGALPAWQRLIDERSEQLKGVPEHLVRVETKVDGVLRTQTKIVEHLETLNGQTAATRHSLRDHLTEHDKHAAVAEAKGQTLLTKRFALGLLGVVAPLLAGGAALLGAMIGGA